MFNLSREGRCDLFAVGSFGTTFLRAGFLVVAYFEGLLGDRLPPLSLLRQLRRAFRAASTPLAAAIKALSR
jgi:hypothetical protein